MFQTPPNFPLKPLTQIPPQSPSQSPFLHPLKSRSKSIWSASQDALLLSLVSQHGASNWKTLSTFIPNRTSKQCRERYFNHLRTGIIKSEWNQEEEWVLFLGVRAYGKRWSKISALLQGRTDNSIKNHWNCKMKKSMGRLHKRLDAVLARNRAGHATQAGQVLEIEQYLMHQIAVNAGKTVEQEIEDVRPANSNPLLAVLDNFYKKFGQIEDEEENYFDSFTNVPEYVSEDKTVEKEMIFLEDIDYLY